MLRLNQHTRTIMLLWLLLSVCSLIGGPLNALKFQCAQRDFPSQNGFLWYNTPYNEWKGKSLRDPAELWEVLLCAYAREIVNRHSYPGPRDPEHGVYIYIYTHVCINCICILYVHIYTRINTYIYIYICIYIFIHMYVYIYRSIDLSIYRFIYLSLSLYICIYIYIYVYIRVTPRYSRTAWTTLVMSSRTWPPRGGEGWAYTRHPLHGISGAWTQSNS